MRRRGAAGDASRALRSGGGGLRRIKAVEGDRRYQGGGTRVSPLPPPFPIPKGGNPEAQPEVSGEGHYCLPPAGARENAGHCAGPAAFFPDIHRGSGSMGGGGRGVEISGMKF